MSTESNIPLKKSKVSHKSKNCIASIVLSNLPEKQQEQQQHQSRENASTQTTLTDGDATPSPPTHPPAGLIDRQKYFWKLARPKFAVINFLCPGCRKHNYKHPDQFRMVSDGEFHFTQVMCPACVKYNMIQTDYYNKHTKNPH